MTFFGYGSFASGSAVLGFPITRRCDVRAGYLMGNRLNVSRSNSDIAIRLTQKGPVFGVEYHWGVR